MFQCRMVDDKHGNSLHPSFMPPTPVATFVPPPAQTMSVEPQWWNVNVPEEQWTVECPEFLHDQADKNVHILSTKDEDHPRMPWAEVKHLINNNRIDQFHRMPTDLRRYLRYCYDLKQHYGSILHFIQYERLEWPSLDTTGDPPFRNKADYKILYNDWPYAIDEEIVHLIIWTKFALDDDPDTGELKDSDKDMVERFITDIFCRDTSDYPTISRKNVAWFKNWRSLRSVHALEHFHVMLYNPPSKLIEKVTKGDRPMCEQFKPS